MALFHYQSPWSIDVVMVHDESECICLSTNLYLGSLGNGGSFCAVAILVSDVGNGLFSAIFVDVGVSATHDDHQLGLFLLVYDFLHFTLLAASNAIVALKSVRR